jgi:hypothetical protein
MKMASIGSVIRGLGRGKKSDIAPPSPLEKYRENCCVETLSLWRLGVELRWAIRRADEERVKEIEDEFSRRDNDLKAIFEWCGNGIGALEEMRDSLRRDPQSRED